MGEASARVRRALAVWLAAMMGIALIGALDHLLGFAGQWYTGLMIGVIAIVGVVAVPFAALGRSLHANSDVAIGHAPVAASTDPRPSIAQVDAAKAIPTDRGVRDLPNRADSRPPSINPRDPPAIGPRRVIGTTSQTASALMPLYRRLPHAPHGMAREEVARHQRARLYGAMIESVSQRGYHTTTVAHVIALAGVSRRAFYEQFPNKQECFLATHDMVVASVRKRALDAWLGERGWANRMHGACKALLDNVAEYPKGPRLVLVDALGVGSQARERMQLTGLMFERLLAAAVAVSPDGVRFPQPTSRGIVGGVRHVVFMRVLENRERELFGLTDEVLDWMASYRTPAATRLRPSLRLPSTPNQPPSSAASLARDDDRARSLASVVHLTLDEGYAQLTDPQIAQFAGISTVAFHKQFANKEECFLAVLDEFIQEALDWTRPNLANAESWPEAVYLAMAAYVDYLFAHQALLRLAFIHSFEVGPGITSHITRSTESLTTLLTEFGPEPRRAPAIAREAITGATWEIIASNVANNRLSRLPHLVDQLVFIVLAPYIGPKKAIEVIEACRKPLRAE
jgi:AcrR family transcriptional regulator